MNRHRIRSVGIVLLMVLGGCAGDRRVVHRQTRIERSADFSSASAEERQALPSSETVVEERTVSTQELRDDEPRGVLSATVHVIGEVLALPFRLVGGLIRAIF